MDRSQLASFKQLLEGLGHLLLTAVSIEELVMHPGRGVADQLQGQGFDAGGMQAAEPMQHAH